MQKELFMNNELLDQEWIDLILDALEMGLSIQDIQAFLQSHSPTSN